jgi:hypothetical protein
LHAEWISLSPFGHQPRAADTHLFFGGDPTDRHLTHAIQEAHEVGLKVMLKPHILLGQPGPDE